MRTSSSPYYFHSLYLNIFCHDKTLQFETGIIQITVLITLSTITDALTAMGVRAADHVMLHVSVKSIGWLVGGPDIIIRSLLGILTKQGTLMMYVGWEDGPYTMQGWDETRMRVYYEECPPFDPRTSRAVRKWSVVAELFRNWPGTLRSNHPDSSFCANGFLATHLTEKHPLKYGFGSESPLARLVKSGGKILLIGAPFDTVTLLHHSEDRAKVPNKPTIQYVLPITNVKGQKEWVHIEEYDTDKGIANDDESSDWYFNKILRDYIDRFTIPEHYVGKAKSFLFDAARLNKFAIQWMENRFGRVPPTSIDPH